MMKKLTAALCLLLMTALFLSGCAPHGSGRAEKKLVIAEPVHLIAYLPLYVAIDKGYFKQEGLDVSTITATGGAHVTSVMSGEAWGVIGGPDSMQIASHKSKDSIVAVANVVNRANVYLMANKKLKLTGDSDRDLAAFLKGKTIAAGRYGGSPNLLTRYLLMKLGLNPNKDVRLEEPADAAAVVSLVSQGKADIANGAEPQINEGMKKGAWGEPFYGFPSLGDYVYSAIGVRQSTIKKDPETVQKFVRALLRGLKLVANDRDEAFRVLKKEFPTTPKAELQAAMDRAYKDHMWSKDGFISRAAVAKPLDVAAKTGIYRDGYEFNKLVNMHFVDQANKK